VITDDGWKIAGVRVTLSLCSSLFLTRKVGNVYARSLIKITRSLIEMT